MGQTFLYWAYAAIMGLLAEGPNKYCDTNCPGNIHVMCENGEGLKDNGPSGPCGLYNIRAKYLTEQQVHQILDFHNEKRRYVASGKEKRGLHGKPQLPALTNWTMPDLEWDHELAALAQHWANQCGKWGEYRCSNTKDYKVGQNVIHTSITNFWASLESQLNDWYNEVDRFDPNRALNYTYEESTRRYAQIVAARTTKIGCGYIQATWNSHDPSIQTGKKNPIRKHSRLICNYGPDGLLEGQPLYEIYWDITKPFPEKPEPTTERLHFEFPWTEN